MKGARSRKEPPTLLAVKVEEGPGDVVPLEAGRGRRGFSPGSPGGAAPPDSLQTLPPDV